MISRKLEILIGVAVLIVTGVFLSYALRVSDGFENTGSLELVAEFSSAQGISRGTDVRMAGVKIGTVSDMELSPISYYAQVRLRVDDTIPLPTDSEIKIETDGLLGGAYVEIVPGANETYLQDGDGFASTSGAISIINLFSKFATGGGE